MSVTCADEPVHVSKDPYLFLLGRAILQAILDYQYPPCYQSSKRILIEPDCDCIQCQKERPKTGFYYAEKGNVDEGIYLDAKEYLFSDNPWKSNLKNMIELYQLDISIDYIRKMACKHDGWAKSSFRQIIK